ncbi:MAG: amidohydrolase family protein [Cyclobacteriaceae bacterium]
MNRRDFLEKTSAVALATPVLLSSCLSKQQIPILDTHQHLWDLSRFPLSWVSPPLDKSFLMSDYLDAIEGTGIEKAIYMEVAVPEELREKEAQWALDVCEDENNPTVGAVICADPTDQGFESYIKTLAENSSLKGIRYFFSSEEEMLEPLVINNLRLLGQQGLSFDLHVSSNRLKTGALLVEKCPDTQFILNHCGGPDPAAFTEGQNGTSGKPGHGPDDWAGDMSNIGQRDNIVCKISGIVNKLPDASMTTALAPIVNHCFEAFSADRVIFASDWPVCLRKMTLLSWVDILKEIVSSYSLTEQRKLFYDNAFSLYRLDA